MTTKRAGRFRERTSVVAFAVTLLLPAVLMSSSAGASTKVHYPPACRAAQIRPSLSIPTMKYSITSDFNATLWFYNAGGTCTFPGNYFSIQAVSGPRRTLVGPGSPVPLVERMGFVLEHARKAYAPVSIGSIRTLAFRELVKKNGGVCKPVLANGIELVAYPHGSWPKAYFSLPGWWPICTSNFFNAGAGFPVKLLTPAEAKLQAVQNATTELQNFLTDWRTAGQTFADRIFVVPSQRVGNYKLLRGQVLTSGVSVDFWSSPRDFSLLVALDLHFTGRHGTWKQGINERIVTFAQPGSSPQLMSFIVPSLPGAPTSTTLGG